jgi:excisionase family DNA binding protein
MEKELKRLEELAAKLEQQLERIATITGLDNKTVWTMKETAAYTGLTPSTLADMARTHDISACKQGKNWYFNRNDVYNWLQRYRSASDEEIMGKAELYCLKNKLRNAIHIDKERRAK